MGTLWPVDGRASPGPPGAGGRGQGRARARLDGRPAVAKDGADLAAALGDELIDHRREQGHWRVAALDNRIVERAQVVTRPELRLGLVAQAQDLEMPDLVAAGLAGHRAIAVDLARHGSPIVAVGLDEPVDGLVAGPALGVEPGVAHQPACPEAG